MCLCVFLCSFIGNTEIGVQIQKYYCNAGIKSIQVSKILCNRLCVWDQRAVKQAAVSTVVLFALRFPKTAYWWLSEWLCNMVASIILCIVFVCVHALLCKMSVLIRLFEQLSTQRLKFFHKWANVGCIESQRIHVSVHGQLWPLCSISC